MGRGENGRTNRCVDGDGEISEEEFLRIMKKTSLY